MSLWKNGGQIVGNRIELVGSKKSVVPRADRACIKPRRRCNGATVMEPYNFGDRVRLVVGDTRDELRKLGDGTFHCCVTSPPYWGLRDYGYDGQIGAEPTIGEYIESLVNVFREVRRVLRDDGTLWLNIGDSYTSGNRTWRDPDKKNPARGMSYRAATPEGLKPKDLIGVPWRLAFALQADGWFLRSDVVWYKPNCQPESVKDRPTQSHEYLFLLSKSQDYYYDHEAVREPTKDGRAVRNLRTVWEVATEPYKGAHFAVFPRALVRPCIMAGSPAGGHVLDPFFGSGTLGVSCLESGRTCVGIEVKPEYAALARERLSGVQLSLLHGSKRHSA
jgi:site-specific DNA-methyltransferase (adenine-specific)/site-specific DNA-methyltransferase (cytosine-N4-specific)